MITVAVLIDHPLDNASGGLVQCWENLSQAARGFEKEFCLDLHFLGRKKTKRRQTSNVTYHTHPALVGTHRLFFLKNIPDEADLAPFNPWLYAHLKKSRYDLIHTTNTFLAFAKTGLRFAKRTGTPLTNSIQTDMPAYTRYYTEAILERLLPRGWAKKLAEKKYLSALRTQEKYLGHCRSVLSFRRGIHRQLFNPNQRDRQKLKERFGLPLETFLLLFVGRVDEGKNILTVVEAARRLLAQKFPIHLLLVGKNDGLRNKIGQQLGPHVTLTGPLPNRDLPAIYAGADLFVFPSQIEIFPNVIIEAKASGLPILMHRDGGASLVLTRPGEDGLVLDTQSPLLWAEAIRGLLLNEERRKKMSLAARAHIEKSWPGWEEVLREDILPQWKKCLANGS